MREGWESGTQVLYAEPATACASTHGAGQLQESPSLSVPTTPSFLVVIPKIGLSSYCLLGGQVSSLPLALLTLVFEQKIL